MKTKNDAIFRDARPADPVATAGNLSVFIPPELRTLQPANLSSHPGLIWSTGVIDYADCIVPGNLVNLCFKTLMRQDAGTAEAVCRAARS
jgi:hypothetical protein